MEIQAKRCMQKKERKGKGLKPISSLHVKLTLKKKQVLKSLTLGISRTNWTWTNKIGSWQIKKKAQTRRFHFVKKK